MDITGTVASLRTWNFGDPSGAFAISSDVQGPSGATGTGRIVSFSASRSWTGSTNSTGAHSHTITHNSAPYTRTDALVIPKGVRLCGCIKY